MSLVASEDPSLPGSLESANQQYEAVRAKLSEGIARKRQIDHALTDLESQIYLYEGSYLTTTAASGGNVIRGFDSFLKANQANTGSARSAAAALQQPPSVDDRMFSTSSATYQRSLTLKANETPEQTKQVAGTDAKDTAPVHSGYKLKWKPKGTGAEI